MTQTKAQLEARVVELEAIQEGYRMSLVSLGKEQDRLRAELRAERSAVDGLSGWQSCAREFMDKRGSTNNFQHVTVCTGAKMVVK